MTAIDLRTEITKLLREESNTSILEAIRVLLRRGDVEHDEDFSPEGLAELDKRRARRETGESEPQSVEESIRIVLGERVRSQLMVDTDLRSAPASV